MAGKLDFSDKSQLIFAKINIDRNKTYHLFKPKQIQCVKAALGHATIGDQATLLKETRKMSESSFILCYTSYSFPKRLRQQQFLLFLQFKLANLVGLFGTEEEIFHYLSGNTLFFNC